jgi:class 3 adenylate cyclase
VLPAVAQDDPKQLEKLLEGKYGVEKLALLNSVSKSYQGENDRKAIKYAKQAVALSDNIFPALVPDDADDEYYLKVDAYFLLGEARFLKEHYYDAQVTFKDALMFAENSNNSEMVSRTEAYLARLDSIGVKSNIFKEAITDLRIGQIINDGSQDVNLSVILKTAETNEKNGNYQKAIEQYSKAINIYKDRGEEEEIAKLHKRISYNFDQLGDMAKAMEHMALGVTDQDLVDDTSGLLASFKNEIQAYEADMDTFEESETLLDTTKIEDTADSGSLMIAKARQSEKEKDYEASLKYYQLYTQLNKEKAESEKQQEQELGEKNFEIERNLQQIQLLTQEKEIQDLELENKNLELERQSKFRRSLVVGLILLVSLAIALYVLYSNKRRNLVKLNKAHEEIKSTQQKLIDAEKRIKTLLEQQISTEVANELISGQPDSKIERKRVCVMFLDIRGFTSFAEKRNPEEIISFQNDVFSFMIDSVYRHHGVINQFLGDGFMATFGAPASHGNDSLNAINAAMEIIGKVNAKSEANEIPPTRIGIGLHTGMVVAGNVGTNVRKQYSITGNAVIIAARIEQLNKKFGSQLLVSEEVIKYAKPENNNFESLGQVELKGRAQPLEIIKVM